MTDVLKIALARRGELRTELAEIDDFIRMADNLLRNMKGAPAPAAEEPLILDHPVGLGRTAETDRASDAGRAGVASAVETAGGVDGAAAERTGDREQEARSDAEEPADEDDASTDGSEEEPEKQPVARTFPWSNAQPVTRKSDADDAGPFRRNLMRREVS